METEEAHDAEQLGRHIRAVRRARNLTLVQLAALADLSHPFLSQVERGLARPSMVSLGRIARALGSSPLELVAGAAERDPLAGDAEPTLVRAGEGARGRYGLGEARLLVSGGQPFRPMVFEASSAEPGDYYTHAEDEFVYVLSGRCRVDLGPNCTFELGVGDSLYYGGGTAHRWSSPTALAYRLLIVKQRLAVSAAEAEPREASERSELAGAT